MLSSEDLKQLNIISYNSKNAQKYGLVKEYKCWHSGLNCCLFNYKNNIILCFVGTHGIQDILADVKLAMSLIPKQAEQAIPIYEQVRNKYQDFIITGHSLGGSIAQILGSRYGNKTFCFSPFGTKLFNKGYHKSVVNYGMESDAVYVRNIENQIGDSYLIPNPKTNNHFIVNGQINYKAIILGKNKMISLRGHFLEDYEKLSSGLLLNESELYRQIISKYIKTPKTSI